MQIPRWLRRPSAAAAGKHSVPLWYGDGWSRAVSGPGLDYRQFRLLHDLLSPDRGPNPQRNSAWCELADGLTARKNEAAAEMLLALLRAMAEGAACRVAGAQPDAGARPLLVYRANSVRAANTIWAAARLAAPDAMPLIGHVLRRTLTEPWMLDGCARRIQNAAVNVLALDGGPSAVAAFNAAIPLALSPGVRKQLMRGLSLAVTGHGAPPSRVTELRVAEHALDLDGERQLIVNRRRYTLRLSPDGRVTLTPAHPNATRDSTATQLAQAEARAVTATYRREVARIEGLLASDRAWPLDEWRRIYLDNPITRAVAARTVWRFDLPDGRTTSVLPDWNRQIRAVDGRLEPADWPGGPSEPNGARTAPEPSRRSTATDPSRPRCAATGPDEPNDAVTRPGGAAGSGTSAGAVGMVVVRLWHPREAAADELAAWRALVTDRRLVQPFPQIERDFTQVEPAADVLELEQCVGVRLARAAFKAAVRRTHWSSRRKNGRTNSDALRFIGRDFPDSHLSVALTCVDRDGLVLLDAAWFYRSDDPIRTPVPLASVPARVYSEAVRDLAVLVREPDPESGADWGAVEDAS